MHRWFAPVVVLIFAAPAIAQTQKAVEVVPEDALGFLLVKDLRQLSDHVEELAKKVKAPAHVSLLELLQKRMGIQKGLNEKGSALFMVLKGKDEKGLPGMVAAVAVSDYPSLLKELGVKDDKATIGEGEIGAPSALLAGIGDTGGAEKAPKMKVVVAKKGDFALLTVPDQREVLQRVLDSRQSIGRMVQPALKWLDEQDIAGVCTNTGIKVGLAMILSTPAGGAESDTRGQFEKMKATFGDFEKNVTLIAFGGRLEKEGHSRLLTRVYVEPTGPYAKTLAKAAPIEGELLSQFAEERYLLAVLARLSPQANFEGFLPDLLPKKISADKARELTAAVTKLRQRVSEVTLVAYADPDHKGNVPAGVVNELRSPTALNGVLVAKVDDAPAFVADATGLVKRIMAEAWVAWEEPADVKFEQRQLAGKQTQLISIADKKGARKSDASKESPPGGIVLTVLDPKTVLVGVLNDTGRAEPFVKQYAERPAHTLGASVQLKKTAALLPDKLQLAAYLNFQAMTANNRDDFKVPECPPLALSLRALPDGVEAQFVIPFDTLRAVFEAANAQTKKSEAK